MRSNYSDVWVKKPLVQDSSIHSLFDQLKHTALLVGTEIIFIKLMQLVSDDRFEDMPCVSNSLSHLIPRAHFRVCVVIVHAYVCLSGTWEWPHWPQQRHGCSAHRWLQDLGDKWNSYPPQCVYKCVGIFSSHMHAIVLFHLIHSLRCMYGVWSPRPPSTEMDHQVQLPGPAFTVRQEHH